MYQLLLHGIYICIARLNGSAVKIITFSVGHDPEGRFTYIGVKMKAKGFVIHQHGGSEVLQWQDIDLPELGPNDVLVRHTAIGINFIDIYFREGLYPTPLPGRLGVEAAGVVEAVGSDVSQYSEGDRVAYCKGGLGSYAQAHVVAESCLIPVPDDVSDETAAAVLLKGLTAAYLLYKTAPLKAGANILIQAAAGGVGTLLSQWAKHLGAYVIGTVGSEEKALLAKKNGCDETILYNQQDVAEEVRRLTDGKGVEVVFDSVGAATCEASLNALAKRGLFVSFGNASGPVEAIAPLTLLQKGSVFMTRPGLADYIEDRNEMLELADLLFSVIRAGHVKVSINQRYDLTDAAKAQDDLAQRLTTGSSILLP
jgi:NADPH2:quinone reductase